MLAAEIVPAFIFLSLILSIPESPRWLVLHRHREDKALKILRTTCGNQEAEKVLAGILQDRDASQQMRLFSSSNRFSLLLAFLIALFNQLSGINFILYYAPEIMEKAGFITSVSLRGAVFIGCTNLVFTLIGMYLIDKVGRKSLMLVGSIGYIFSLILVSYAFYTGADPRYNLLFILLFIASHGIGQGAVIWVFISEIFPTKVRAMGQSFGAGVHWGMAAIITLFGAVLIDNFPPWQIFLLFASLMVLQLLFVIFLMPETKGITLETLSGKLNDPSIHETKDVHQYSNDL